MIRKIEKIDYKIVMDIWYKTNILFHVYIPKEYWEQNYDKVLNEYLPNSDTYLYEENNIIKGFVSIINNNYIGGIFVEQNFQSQGIGSKLLNFVSKKYQNLSLTVYVKNDSAIKFYKKNGFKIIKKQLSDYKNEEEYIMSNV